MIIQFFIEVNFPLSDFFPGGYGNIATPIRAHGESTRRICATRKWDLENVLIRDHTGLKEKKRNSFLYWCRSSRRNQRKSLRRKFYRIFPPLVVCSLKWFPCLRARTSFENKTSKNWLHKPEHCVRVNISACTPWIARCDVYYSL